MNKIFLDKIRVDFPEFRFIVGKKFTFRPPRTIAVDPEEQNAKLLLMHELGHALLGHREFKTDVRRIKMESEAWEKARELCDKYGVKYDEEVAQTELDTYRDWLHKKSRCPECGLTRFQTKDGDYHCPRCEMI